MCVGTSISSANSPGPTVIDSLCTDHFEFSLDIRIKVLDKVEMVGQLLPLDQVVYPILVPNIAFPANISKGLSIGMNGRQE